MRMEESRETGSGRTKSYDLELPLSTLPDDIQNHPVVQAAPELFTKNVWLRGGAPIQAHYDRFDLYLIHFQGDRLFSKLQENGLAIAADPIVCDAVNRDESGSASRVSFESFCTEPSKGNELVLDPDSANPQKILVRDFSLKPYPLGDYPPDKPLRILAHTNRSDLSQVDLLISLRG